MFEQMHDNQTCLQGFWIPIASVICISLWVRLGPAAHGRSVSFCCRATCCRAMATRVGRQQASGCGDVRRQQDIKPFEAFWLSCVYPSNVRPTWGCGVGKRQLPSPMKVRNVVTFPSLAPCMRCKIVGYLRVKSPKPKGAAPTI